MTNYEERVRAALEARAKHDAAELAAAATMALQALDVDIVMRYMREGRPIEACVETLLAG